MLTFSIEARVSGCRQDFQFDYLQLYNIVAKFLNLISERIYMLTVALENIVSRCRRFFNLIIAKSK